MGRSVRLIGFLCIVGMMVACSKDVSRSEESAIDNAFPLVAARWPDAAWLPDVKRGFAAYEARDAASAEAALALAWQKGCRDSLVTYRYAFVLERRQDSARARELYHEAARLLEKEYPTHPYVREVWHNLGHIEYRAEHFEEALALYRKAIAGGKEATSEMSFSMGMALRRMKRYAEAIGWFEKANLADFRVNFYMADVYYELKKFDLAMHAMERAVKADPDSIKALGSLAHFWYALSERHEEKGDFAAAQASIRQAVTLYERAIKVGGTNYSEYRTAAKARDRDLERIRAAAKTNGLTRIE